MTKIALGNSCVILASHQYMGKSEEALDTLQRAIKVAQELGDQNGEGYRISNLGNVYLRMDNSEMAQVHYEHALRIRRASGDLLGTAVDLNNLGNLHMRQGDYVLARIYLEEAETLFEQVNSPHATVSRRLLEILNEAHV